MQDICGVIYRESGSRAKYWAGFEINIGLYSEGILRKQKYDSGNSGHNLIQDNKKQVVTDKVYTYGCGVEVCTYLCCSTAFRGRFKQSSTRTKRTGRT